MFTRLKLWWNLKKIRAAEEHEHELMLNLNYVRNTVLPQLRIKHNRLLYPLQGRSTGNSATSRTLVRENVERPSNTRG